MARAEVGSRCISRIALCAAVHHVHAHVHDMYVHHVHSFSIQVAKDNALHRALAWAGLSKEGVVARMKEAGVETVEDVESLSAAGMESLPKFVSKATLTPLEEAALGKYMTMDAHDQGSTADDELATLKAKTMYKLIEDVEDSKSGIKKLLFLSSKQADLIARDPSAIDKMLAIFVDKQQPRMVINLLPSMIRCWTRVRPPPGDPDGEREGLAALDRFMAKHIIPLAVQTHAIIVCSAVQPFCVLSESLSRMVKLVRSRWGPELPFTILSCTGQLPALYTVKREDTTWREIRNLSRVWKKREKEGLLEEVEVKLKKHRKKGLDGYLDGKNFDMDLDPNGTNFIIVDPTSSCSSAKYDSYNRLITEIVRKLAAEFPSIAIQTGKSKFSSLAESNASGIEVALSNMETGTPVLMLDLTKRDVMPKQLAYGQQTSVSSADVGPAASKPTPAIAPEDENAEPAAHRQQQIEWHRAQVENEERRRVQKDLPDYDWDVCMISHFHDGARRSLTRCAHRTHRTLASHIAHTTRIALCWRAAGGAVLFDDGDYQSSETPAQKINLRVKDKLWQAIDREKLSNPLVNDEEIPVATAEQARVCTLPKLVDGSRCSLR